MQKVLTLFFLVQLATISYGDIKTGKIRDRQNAGVFLLGVAAMMTIKEPSMLERIGGVFAVSVPMAMIAWMTRGGFGGGDIKLMAAGGMFLGWKGNFRAAEIGFVLGGLYGCFLLFRDIFFSKDRKQDSFPFGPCLSLGMAVVSIESCMGNAIS
ncbi:MAG: A24 family peptidase [Eubacteriales bacterium]|nr:A24 family peptidase [Eubacteriales bacterium]